MSIGADIVIKVSLCILQYKEHGYRNLSIILTNMCTFICKLPLYAKFTYYNTIMSIGADIVIKVSWCILQYKEHGYRSTEVIAFISNK